MAMEEFFDDCRPEYAIISHTWGKNEVTYQDFQQPHTARSKKGRENIENAVRLTHTEGLDYSWIDTCCIDKTSSAELQEAINSMYAWYKDCTYCFAFLSDIWCPRMTDTFFVFDDARMGCTSEQRLLLGKRVSFMNEPYSLVSKHMTQSRWSSRGWTLQELVAPMEMQFFHQAWSFIGLKTELCKVISRATGIATAVLNGDQDVHAVSVAQRMFWAAGKKPSRAEDRAYSLLGIFDVTMPLIYGEGHKAFVRLQEEIVRASDDDSIFAWETVPLRSPHDGGLLAPSPDNFALAGCCSRRETGVIWIDKCGPSN